MIYILKGKARMRWGEKLEFTAEAGPGDFIYVPPYGKSDFLQSCCRSLSFHRLTVVQSRIKKSTHQQTRSSSACS